MLKGKKVSLRHMVETDLEVRIAYQGTTAGTDPYYVGTSMESPHRLKARFLKDGYSSAESESLTILDDNQRVIGSIKHSRARPYSDAREIGWVIYSHQDRGQGFGAEAARLLVHYLFQNFPVNRLECGASPHNIPSIAIAKKLGFIQEGLLRGCVFVNGVYEDSAIFGLTRNDWELTRPYSPH